jgi:hypothetical protein
MVGRIEKITDSVLLRADERQVEEAVQALAKGLEKFY